MVKVWFVRSKLTKSASARTGGEISFKLPGAGMVPGSDWGSTLSATKWIESKFVAASAECNTRPQRTKEKRQCFMAIDGLTLEVSDGGGQWLTKLQCRCARRHSLH